MRHLRVSIFAGVQPVWCEMEMLQRSRQITYPRSA